MFTLGHSTIATIAGATLLAACGTNGGAQPSARARPTLNQTTATPTASRDAEDALVLRAIADWAIAFDSAVREMNPDDPRLPATATGKQLVRNLTTLNQWKIEGITAKGDLPHVIDSRVEARTATTANIKACIYDPGILIYKATGRDAPTNAAGQFYVDFAATLELIGGTWKVSDSNTQSEYSACLPGF